MSYLPPRPMKTRQMMERYQHLRRRQLLTIVGFTLIVLAAIGGLAVLIVLFKAKNSTPSAEQSGRPSAHRQPPQMAQVVHELALERVPQFLALDDEHLIAGYCAALDATEAGTSIDIRTAYKVLSGEKLWEATDPQQASWLGLTAGNLILLREYYSDPPQVQVKAFSGETGASTWQMTLDHADQCRVQVTEKVLILGFRTNARYSIAGYNAATGVKGWVVPLSGNQESQQDLSVPGQELDISVTNGIISYRLGNRAGLIAAGTGKVLRKVQAPGHVYEMEYDSFTETAYILSAGKAQDEYLLQAVPAGGGSALDLLRFNSADSDTQLLLADHGYAVLAYPGVADVSSTTVSKLVCFTKGLAEPVQTQTFDAGTVWDIAPLSQAPGEFIVALAEQVQDGRPAGWSKLYRMRAVDQAFIKVQEFNTPILYCLPFKDDVAIAVQGGDVYSLRPNGMKLKRLLHTDLPALDAYISPSAKTMAFVCYDPKEAQAQKQHLRIELVK